MTQRLHQKVHSTHIGSNTTRGSISTRWFRPAFSYAVQEAPEIVTCFDAFWKTDWLIQLLQILSVTEVLSSCTIIHSCLTTEDCYARQHFYYISLVTKSDSSVRYSHLTLSRQCPEFTEGIINRTENMQELEFRGPTSSAR